MNNARTPLSQPEGNFYDKYRTRNPIARALMSGFLREFDALLDLCKGDRTAIEAGCGEGELSIRMARRQYDVRSFDVSASVLDEARSRSKAEGVAIDFRIGALPDQLPVHERSDLVVCCEVLEHLDDPRAGLVALSQLCNRHLLVSVPREPIWRAMNLLRGAYLPELGNTPGHIQHWSKRTFLRFLSSEVDVVAVRSPLPWTMALCRPRS